MRKALTSQMGLALLILLAAACEKEVGDVVRPPAGVDTSAMIPASAQVESAALHLYCLEAPGARIRVHRISAPWDGGVTWGGFGEGYSGTIEGTLQPPAAGWTAVDVAGALQGWIAGDHRNYGVLLRQDSLLYPRTFFSAVESNGRGPWLELCYRVGGQVTCDSVKLAVDAYIDADLPDGNFSGADRLATGALTEGGGESMALIRFALRLESQITAIGDRVWDDLNKNGTQDGGETGVGAVTVRLLTCDDKFVAEMPTDASGAYRFTGMPPGEYKLVFVRPEGWAMSPQDQGGDEARDSDAGANGYTDCFTIGEEEVHDDLDAGIYLIEVGGEGEIGDWVWHDVDGDGRRDGGESGLPGIRVRLLECSGTEVAQTTTDDGGYYRFRVEPESYRLRFEAPAAWVFSPMNQDDEAHDSDAGADGLTACFDLAAGEMDLSWDAGLYEPASQQSCTRSVEYWKANAGYSGDPDMVSPYLPIWLGRAGGAKSVLVSGPATAYAVLARLLTAGGNGIGLLYAELLGTRLNVAAGAEATDVQGIFAGVDSFLALHDGGDWDNLSKADREQVIRWKEQFEAFNEGVIGPGECDDDD